MSWYYDKEWLYSGVPSRNKDDLLTELELKNQEQEKFAALLKGLLQKDKKYWAVTVLGTVGNGKTTLACAAVNQWNCLNSFYDHPGYYCTQSSIARESKDTFSKEGKTEADIFRKYAYAPVLVIDELNSSATEWTDYTKNFIQKILVERYANERRTVLIGNINADEIKTMLDPHILSRLREGKTMLMTAPDMRVAAAF